MRLIIPGEPVAKERPRLNRKTGGVYTPKKTVDYEKMVAWHARASGRQFDADRPLKAIFDFYCTAKTRGKIPDWDNLGKAASDGLVLSGVVPDDCWFVDVEVHRWFDPDNPRTEIEVEYAF